MRSKMAYFSDIDLATLDRSRLNERIEYKLSLFNRPMYTNPVYKTPNNHISNGSCYRNHQQVGDNRKDYYAIDKLMATNKKTSLQQHSTPATANACKPSTAVNSNPNHSIQNNDDGSSNGSMSIETKQMARNSNDNNSLNCILNRTTTTMTTTTTNIDVNKQNTPSFKQRSIKQSNAIHESLITAMDRECVNDQRCIADVTEQRSFANELSVPHRKRSGTWP